MRGQRAYSDDSGLGSLAAPMLTALTSKTLLLRDTHHRKAECNTADGSQRRLSSISLMTAAAPKKTRPVSRSHRIEQESALTRLSNGQACATCWLQKLMHTNPCYLKLTTFRQPSPMASLALMSTRGVMWAESHIQRSAAANPGVQYIRHPLNRFPTVLFYAVPDVSIIVRSSQLCTTYT